MEPQIIDYYRINDISRGKKSGEYYIQRYGIKMLKYAQIGYEDFYGLDKETSLYGDIYTTSAGIARWARHGRKINNNSLAKIASMTMEECGE